MIGNRVMDMTTDGEEVATVKRGSGRSGTLISLQITRPELHMYTSRVVPIMGKKKTRAKAIELTKPTA